MGLRTLKNYFEILILSQCCSLPKSAGRVSLSAPLPIVCFEAIWSAKWKFGSKD